MLKRLGGALLAGIFVASATLATPAAAKDKVTAVMSTHGFVYLPALVADVMGYYEQENIAPDLVTTGGESKSLAALMGGGADIYMGSPSTAFRARSAGADVLVIGATISQYASNFVISGKWAKQYGLTEKSTYEERLRALKGATIAITAPGSGTDLVVRFLSKQAGLNPDRDLTITALGNGETMTAALVQGRIDGFTLSAPAAENAVKNHGAMMLFNFSKGEVKELDGFLYIGLNARESWIKKNPELTVRVLRAHQKALNAIHDPELTIKARDAVWKKYHSKTDKPFFNYVWAETQPAFPKTIEISSATIDRIVKFVNEFEKQPLDPALVEKAWTNEYAQKATASLKK